MEIVSVENDRTKKGTTSSTGTVRGYILERDEILKRPGRDVARSNNNNNSNNKKKDKIFHIIVALPISHPSDKNHSPAKLYA